MPGMPSPHPSSSKLVEEDMNFVLDIVLLQSLHAIHMFQPIQHHQRVEPSHLVVRLWIYAVILKESKCWKEEDCFATKQKWLLPSRASCE
jgi:hypothetical protein